MRIDGGMQSYAEYGNHYTGKIPQVSVEEVKRQDLQNAAQTSSAPALPAEAAPQQTPEAQKASRIADLEHVSISFHKNDDFGYIGRESSLVKLDVEKALSDMKKDSVLEEYQYFVGSGRMQQSPDGIVIAKGTF